VNQQLTSAEKLLFTMQRSTIEAFRVSSGIDIHLHIRVHENLISRRRTMMLIMSEMIVFVSMWFHIAIKGPEQLHALVITLGTLVALVVLVLAFILPDKIRSIELQDFLARASRLVPLPTANTDPYSFEERVRKVISDCENGPATKLAAVKMDAAYFGIL